METVERYLNANQERFVQEMIAFLSIPSISALPEHASDVREAGSWAADRLRAAGIEHVQILETGGHPVVYGDWLHAPSKPTILIYAHFDTQPVDPIDLWHHAPFEPTIEGDRIYARGATDDKGNLLAPVVALEALLTTRGTLPVNIKVLFEGQEEIGSPQLPAFISSHRELLACDAALSADTGQFSEDQPSLTVGLKGICGLQIDMEGPDHDVHSGVYGGAIQNPLHAMVRLLDSMRSAAGKITVNGLYAGVAPLSPEDREAIAAVPFDEEAYLQDLGVTALFGEPGYSPRERAWARPTLEINGLWGGFTGQGTKTVIPSTAHAKITCRLVPDQDPARVIESIRSHVAKNTPAGVEVTVTATESGSRAYLIPTDDPYLAAAREVLRTLYGREPYLERTGGSVPITTSFKDILGIYTVSYGFGLPDERIHSPNEFFRLSSFRRAQSAYCRILDRLSQPLGA